MNARLLVVLATTFGLALSSSGKQAHVLANELRIPGANRSPLASSGVFIRNDGQWDSPALFVAQLPGHVALVESGGVRLAGAVANEAPDEVLMAFTSAVDSQGPVGADRAAGRFNYLIGNDRQQWHVNVPCFSRVVYPNAFPGVDVILRVQGAHIEYDLVFRAGARVDDAVFELSGVEELSIDESGRLVAATATGSLRQEPPPTWEVGGEGEHIPVKCEYRLLGDSRFGFTVESRDVGRELVIDPGLEWSTFMGGVAYEQVEDMAIGPDGSVTIVGYSKSRDLPVTPGAFDPIFAGGTGVNADDAFVCQFDVNGELRFCTYLGGVAVTADFAQAVDVGPDGAITVGGWTGSSDFPVTSGAFDTIPGSPTDAFVTRLTPDGTDLVFSTFISSDTPLTAEMVEALEVMPDGETIVVGQAPVGFPTTPGAFQEEASATAIHGFVTRLNKTGSGLVYSTYLSGTGGGNIADVVVTPPGRPIVVGGAKSPDHPLTPGAYVGVWSATTNPFVTCLETDGSELFFSGSVGGSSSETPTAVALGPLGEIVITGHTASFADFPVTPDAYQLSGMSGFGPDGFVAVLDPTGSRLLYGTYLAAGYSENPDAVLVDSSGAIVVAGSTNSFDYPTTPGAFDQTSGPASNTDLLVSRFSPDRTTLEYSTIVGSALDDEIGPNGLVSLGLAPDGGVVLAAASRAADYPVTPGAFQTIHAGVADAVVTKLDLLPTGAARFGVSTPGCVGQLVISVTEMPQLGSHDFAVTCTNAPPLETSGLLAVSLGALTSALPFGGVGVWVDPLQLVRLLPLRSDVLGYAERVIPLVHDPGVPVNLQAFWPDACAPGGLSASAGLTLVVQP